MNFLTEKQVKNIADDYTTPVYVYSEEKLIQAADNFLAFPSAFGHSVRYAMKANANINILNIFRKKGLKIDCSSEYEVYRALNAGFDATDLQISGQEIPKSLEDFLEKGVFMVATSLNQIIKIGEIAKKNKKNYKIGVRINPGVSSGAFAAISTGGLNSGFGIWHEKLDLIKSLSKKYGLIISKIHIHIGSENTPESWTNSANIGLGFVVEFDDVEVLDMGGGFKKAIIHYEQSADLEAIGKSVSEKFQHFYEQTGRKIFLEIEPGKALVINACSVVAEVDDIVNTGENGYAFIRSNTGMTEMPRVSMYGVQQPIYVIHKAQNLIKNIEEDFVVIGHCCESGDLMTCKLYENEKIEPVRLSKPEIGDLLVVDGVGAYNSSMSMKNYNSFPEAGEIMVMKNGCIKEIRRRQEVEDIWKNEVLIK